MSGRKAREAEDLSESLFLVHLAATWFMTGVIWFVQAVHYPMFDGVGAVQFPKYAVTHAKRTTLVVAPLMLVEMGSATALLAYGPAVELRWLFAANFAALAAIWLSTFLIQVPCHDKLRRGFDARVHRRLTASNLIRTFLWTARALALGWAAAVLLGHGAQ